jgi:hypothetical protein
MSWTRSWRSWRDSTRCCPSPSRRETRGRDASARCNNVWVVKYTRLRRRNR